MLAKKAWYLLSKNFEFSLREGTSTELRGEMLLGAHLAGMAIESSMLGAAHACANPLTSRYEITHGVAVGLMLPHVIDFNSHVVEKLYRELLITSGAHVLKEGKTEESLVKQIKKLRTAANLPDKLRDCQIDRRDLPQLAKEASGQWTGKFNPRPISETELLKLYEQAY
jgi:alcohol dehydrogenase